MKRGSKGKGNKRRAEKQVGRNERRGEKKMMKEEEERVKGNREEEERREDEMCSSCNNKRVCLNCHLLTHFSLKGFCSVARVCVCV